MEDKENKLPENQENLETQDEVQETPELQKEEETTEEVVAEEIKVAEESTAEPVEAHSEEPVKEEVSEPAEATKEEAQATVIQLVLSPAGNLVKAATSPGSNIASVIKEIKTRLEDGKTIDKIA